MVYLFKQTKNSKNFAKRKKNGSKQKEGVRNTGVRLTVAK
jgi:hypothetical protein